MTTQDCADLLNDITVAQPAGEKLFTRRFIRERVEDGKLVAVINIRGGSRERARIEIAAADLCAYVRQHHPSLIGPLEQRLRLAA